MIDNMVIDTGAVKTLISQNAVEDIDFWIAENKIAFCCFMFSQFCGLDSVSISKF